MPWTDRLLFILAAVGILLILIGVPIYLLTGGLRTFASGPLRRCYDGIEMHETPQPGDVILVYHTYRGFLLWMTQDEHRIIAPFESAERILGRLLRFNLTWGLLSYGFVFIPLFAVGNYFAQKRSLQSQRERQPPGNPI